MVDQTGYLNPKTDLVRKFEAAANWFRRDMPKEPKKAIP